jgi:hypothetical protein
MLPEEKEKLYKKLTTNRDLVFTPVCVLEIKPESVRQYFGTPKPNRNPLFYLLLIPKVNLSELLKSPEEFGDNNLVSLHEIICTAYDLPKTTWLSNEDVMDPELRLWDKHQFFPSKSVKIFSNVNYNF